MQTGKYIKVDDVLFNISGFSGDKSYFLAPKAFYISLIADAFQELNMDTLLLEGHADFKMPTDTLTIPLPDDCFNVRNVWVYDGEACNIGRSKKVWHKRNYFTEGHGYLANRTGQNNNDPFYLNDTLVDFRSKQVDKSLIRYANETSINEVLFYNIQNGHLMISSSCLKAGSKIHIHYNSTGCEVGEAPIIPVFYKTAIEDHATEAALRFRMANDSAGAKNWLTLQQIYAQRLDKDGYNGSWHKAINKSTTMSAAERADLATYLGRGPWATGR